jgi:cellulose synthase/poly-beta-1,6-N-acetylglucosamine synthase-like glycosyltransferase
MLLAAYTALVAILSAHGAHRLYLASIYLKTRNRPPVSGPAQFCKVTVQLPLFNEAVVAARVVDAAASLDWPLDKLQLQILDDSTDATLIVAASAIERARARGLEVEVKHRTHRTGFKAGALAAAMGTATGELIAIFDADFIPDPGFLKRLVPYLTEPDIGMVQACWGHLNEETSTLTQAQGLLLDGHFVIEHTARNRGGVWFHFNGTAGIWRKSCIEAAGGWQQDTLTEDLDLSYRAQLAGWTFIYCLDEVAPAELPESLTALRSQQARWARGSVQVLKKLGWKLLTAPYPYKNRLEALAHLGANLAWPLGLLVALVLPVVASIPEREGLAWFLLDLPAFLLSTGANAIFYLVARPKLAALPRVLLVLLLGIGLSIGQTIAVLQGLWGKSGSFVRTLKTGGKPRSFRFKLSPTVPLELLLSGWSGFGMLQAIGQQHYGVLPFLGLFAAGFGWVGILGVQEAWQSSKTKGIELLPAGESNV